MPTISQLPSVALVTAADQVPLSQAGVTSSVSIGTLLAGMQPAVMAATGTLLGRTSLGPGGPEPVTIGTGLLLNGVTLNATGADHAGFATQSSLVATDQLVLSSAGQPRLLQLALLRNLFAAGKNIAIDASGTISASGIGGSGDTSGLPSTATASSTDLIAISQAGIDYAISYSALINGQTIDSAQPAASAQDSDTFWVAQGSSTMVRQTLSSLWNWVTGKLPSVKQPVVELSTDTTLDTTVHNGRMLVCSQPMSLHAVMSNMGNGFACDVLNMSSGAVTLDSAITTSSGASAITPGQGATIRCITYSGGTVVYAALSGVDGSYSPPGTVTGLSIGTTTQSSVTLVWLPAAGASSYMVQYRIEGTTSWLLACSEVAAVTYAVGGLLPSTVYEFAVTAVNAGGNSPTAATTAGTTTAPLAVPGQVTGLATNGITSNSITLSWSVPTSGGATASYTVQFRISGAGTWATASTGITGTQYTVTGLVPNTAYDFEVNATNLSGNGPTSTVATATTSQLAGSVTSITWNVVPSGTYSHGIGSIGVNAHINPGTAAVRFGFSSSISILPDSWTSASYVNTDLWGSYISPPATAGTWYLWASGVDGSCPTVYSTGFTVT